MPKQRQTGEGSIIALAYTLDSLTEGMQEFGWSGELEAEFPLPLTVTHEDGRERQLIVMVKYSRSGGFEIAESLDGIGVRLAQLFGE